MDVDVNNLKQKVSQLRKNVNDYDDYYINIYSELKKSSYNWHDNISTKFYYCVEEKRLKIENNIKELNEIIKIYQYVIDQYEELGTKIKVNLQKRDYAIQKFDNYINKINNIISYYNSLDLSFCPNIAYYLNKEKQQLINDRDNILKLKQQFKNIFDLVDNTRKEINLKISKINIEPLNEINVDEYV